MKTYIVEGCATGFVAIAVAMCVGAVATFATPLHADSSHGNLLANPSCDEALVNGGEIPSWLEVIGNAWTRRTSPAPQHGSAFFYAGVVGGTAQLAQTVDLSTWAAQIDAGRVWIQANEYVNGPNDTDASAFRLEVANAGGVDLFGVTTPLISPNTWTYVAETFEVPAGARMARMHLFSQRNAGSENNGYHDNCHMEIYIGPLLTLVQPITLPNAYPGAAFAAYVPSQLASPGMVSLTEGATSTAYSMVSVSSIDLKLDGVGGSSQTEIHLSNFAFEGSLTTDSSGELSLDVAMARAALLPDQVPGSYEGLVRFRVHREVGSHTYQSNFVDVPVQLTVLPCESNVIYVDDDALPAGDGTSWATAYDNLKLAKTEAICNGNPVGIEVRVAQGTYTPNHDNNPQRTDSFELSSYMTIRGGYAGVGAPDPDAWDPDTYVTILTGDLQGDDFARNRGVNNGNNSFSVVKAINVVDAVLEGLTITGGNANGVDLNHSGGGLHIDGGSLTIADCTFASNYASAEGGAVHITNGGLVDFTNCAFQSNHARDGGGVYQRNSSSTTLTNCSFESNSAMLDGGGLHVLNSTIIADDCVFTNNTAEGNGQDGGGGVYGSNADFIFSNCDFMQNHTTGTSGDGGGALFENTTIYALENCTFVKNTSLDTAGGLRTTASRGTLLNCQFTNNQALRAGAIWHQSPDGTVAHSGCSFTGNSVSQRGGAVYLETAFSLVSFNHCAFVGNEADVEGGALYSYDSTFQMTECDLSDNQAVGPGGAMRISGADIDITRCNFVNNSTQAQGGAVHATRLLVVGDTILDFFNCRFVGNSAIGINSNNGGAIDAAYVILSAQSCIFSGNSASTFGGAAVVFGTGSTAWFNNSTISNNSASGEGGGIYSYSGTTVNLRNNIVWGNTSPQASILSRQVTNNGTVVARNSCIEAWDGVLGGNVSHRIQNANPLFLDPDGVDDVIGTLDDDYRLDRRSLCIDWGGDLWVPVETPTDILGNLRIVNCVDLGAVEHDGVSTEMIQFGCDSNSLVACFQGIGDLPGGAYLSEANTINADGDRVGGNSVVADGELGLVWTVGGPAVVQQPNLSRGIPPSLNITGISNDGTKAVGIVFALGLHAASWDICNGTILLSSSFAHDLSADGSIAVGGHNGPVKWINGGAPQSLGILAGGEGGVAYGVSHNGLHIVGDVSFEQARIATIWSNGGAPAALTPGGPSFYFSTATDVSADGMVAVGLSGGLNDYRACIFDPTGLLAPTLLGDLPGFTGVSIANAVSADGRVIVGGANLVPNFNDSQAFFYTEWTGTLNLKTLLETKYGLAAQLSGWTLENATDVSSDGRTIVGHGLNPLGQPEGWIVHLPYLLPCSTDLVPAPQGDGQVNVSDLFYLLAQWATNGPGADIAPPNNIVDVADLFGLLADWGACPMD